MTIDRSNKDIWVHESCSLDIMDYKVTDIIIQLQNAVRVHGPTCEIRMRAYDYEEERPFIFYKRLETDKERDLRIQKEEMYEKRTEEAERILFNKLKKKFG